MTGPYYASARKAACGRSGSWQPRHSALVAALNPAGDALQSAAVDFRDHRTQSKMVAMDFEADMYYLVSRVNGQVLADDSSRLVYSLFQRGD